MLREFVLPLYKFVTGLTIGQLDRIYFTHEVPPRHRTDHLTFRDTLVELANHEGMRVLEIGSREVTGPSDMRRRFSKAEYIGFDYHPGNNVDVVGDVHRLSQYVSGQFDLIYSSACLEHFAMPWLVSLEISKLLKVGGHVFVETHFSFSSHERPWNFFQFSDMGLRVLFCPALGFECIEAGMSNPMVGRFARGADDYLRYSPVRDLYCHSGILARKVRDVPDFQWDEAALRSVIEDTSYPAG